MKLEYIVSSEISGKVLKFVLKCQLNLSARIIKKLKYSNKIFLNRQPSHINTVVYTGDLVEVYIDFQEKCDEMTPENIKIDIIYEDNCLLVINKQANIVVHPTFNHPRGTIANGILHYLNSKNEYCKVRPVSRLDKDTSGIIIFAKNQYVQEFLVKQMKNNTFKKEYIGIVHGLIQKPFGTIDLPIARKPDSIMLRHVSPEGSLSVTHFELIERYKEFSLLKFFLETGRTHQIRVHCQAIGHPLLGETLYNDMPTELIKRQALHSHKVSFIHPSTGEFLKLSASLPEDMVNVLEQF